MARKLTVEEAALSLGCHVETIRRAIRRRELLAQKDPVSRGPRYLIDPADLRAFVDKRKAL
jgi:excisionase family DNA binding protein